MKPVVFIVGGGDFYEEMYRNQGWVVGDKLHDADLIQFTGGEDVNPALYGEKKHPYTFINKHRDETEQRIFNLCITLGKPMVGICRGGQFLNVMCGGELWQHVDNHALPGTHKMWDLPTGQVINITSTHHQMMRPSEEGIIVAVAGNRSSFKEMMAGKSVYTYEVDEFLEDEQADEDVEVVYYHEQKVLCHQGHPEYMNKDSSGVVYFFGLLNDYLNISVHYNY